MLLPNSSTEASGREVADPVLVNIDFFLIFVDTVFLSIDSSFSGARPCSPLTTLMLAAGGGRPCAGK